ncbi:hypothetical protein M407DRAFT_222802 [Tulasnella calospora MUT 4182]|uniref:Prolyl endopeptidase n=1 Tax=Tulasnella calospora MUT 4182 TaxID=1051891 RepID=A0A0C3LDE1_9AGAM|nr:hypothetical protein M407DRAFT_222802 [Tulasnella calospora MUT 4182]
MPGSSPNHNPLPLRYPTTRRTEHLDTYRTNDGEVKVPDPYDWLEQENEERRSWLDQQGELTENLIGMCKYQQNLELELTKNWDFSRFSSPRFAKDGRWYWNYNSGLQAQYILYRSKTSALPKFDVDGDEGPEAQAEVFFDPNLLVEDGTAYLATSAFSKDGRYFAYGISLSGSDFFNIYVRDSSKPFNKRPEGGFLNDPDSLPDIIRFVKFSTIVWTHDSKGFFYQGFTAGAEHEPASESEAGPSTRSDQNAGIYYHVLGTDQSQDVLVYKDNQNSSWLFGIGTSEPDGRFIELYISKDTSHKNKLYMAYLGIGGDIASRVANLKWHKIVDSWDAEYSIVSNHERKHFVITDKDAPRKKVVTFEMPEGDPTENPEPTKFEEFIPEHKDGGILSSMSPVNGRSFVAQYSRNVCDELYVVSSTGQFSRLDPNFVGTLSAAPKQEDDFFFATFSGFNNPGVIKQFRFKEKNVGDFEGHTWKTWRKTRVKGLFADEFNTKQVWYKSKDGVDVPMFIVWHKDTPLDGTAPAIQYGYGGFSDTVRPFFSVSFLTFVKAFKGLLAVPGIRGGAEKGEQWHLDGVRENRVKVYDDFIFATKYLVHNKYAAPGKVVINGRSNGGTLVAACINRAEQGTFGVAVADVGVMDLLKFPQFTIGAAWVSDYGDPRDPNDFDFIKAYSPLHNVPTYKEKALPPTILLTADHDDRVVPLHSFKHIATLQHDQRVNRSPMLLRVERKSGHGAGKSTDKAIQEATDKWSFVALALDLHWQSK